MLPLTSRYSIQVNSNLISLYIFGKWQDGGDTIDSGNPAVQVGNYVLANLSRVDRIFLISIIYAFRCSTYNLFL